VGKILSKNFPKALNRLMGLYEEDRMGSFPVLVWILESEILCWWQLLHTEDCFKHCGEEG
jgi:hypothetical protein